MFSHGLISTYVIRSISVILSVVISTIHWGPAWLSGKVLGQDTSEPQPSTGETQERHE